MSHKALGRRVPQDWEHVEKYPFSAVQPSTVATVEKTLALPSWHWSHDQGYEGSCVGHGASIERSIMNMAQRRAAGTKPYSQRYNPLWLWDRAKEIDYWPDTNPGDNNGTSVRAAYDILRTKGHVPVYSVRNDVNGNPYVVGEKELDYNAGISTNRWARSVDEMRTAIADGHPVVIGVNWYSRFDSWTKTGYQTYWMAQDNDNLGSVRGGHCVCIYAASDRRQAFKIKNSWGKSYPLAWCSYNVMQRLLGEYGEATLQIDR